MVIRINDNPQSVVILFPRRNTLLQFYIHSYTNEDNEPVVSVLYECM